MPVLARPDGVDLHYERRGEGPLVILAPHYFAPPTVFARVAARLASDHLVVVYDPRGTGASTRVPPAGLDEDADDLIALTRECGGGAVVLGWGDGYARAAIAAVRAPDAVRAVVSAGAALVSRLEHAEGAAASREVFAAFIQLARTNYRAALRSHLELTNPDLSDEELQERLDRSIAYCPPETAIQRAAWFTDRGIDQARALGDRLWVIHWESGLAPVEFARALERELPEAHFELLAEGAISRPDLTADVVRRAVAAAEKGE